MGLDVNQRGGVGSRGGSGRGSGRGGGGGGRGGGGGGGGRGDLLGNAYERFFQRCSKVVIDSHWAGKKMPSSI